MTLSVVRLVSSLPDGDAIGGLTSLNSDLYVSRYQSLDIEVYDTDTLTLRRHQTVPGLFAVNDMTACYKQRCVYIADHGNNVVHRLDTLSTVITQWPVNDMPAGLSVNSMSNVLVTCCQVGKV